MATPHGLMVKRCSLEIIERVQNGEIGELKLIEIQSPAWDIINAGIHWLNFAVNLNGRIAVESVLAACDKTTRTFRDGMQVETVAVTYVKMVNGIRIVMHSGDTVRSNGRRDRDTVTFRIIGTAGQIEFWGWAPDYHLIDARHPEGILSPQRNKRPRCINGIWRICGRWSPRGNRIILCRRVLWPLWKSAKLPIFLQGMELRYSFRSTALKFRSRMTGNLACPISDGVADGMVARGETSC